jgi:hypothetical protein
MAKRFGGGSSVPQRLWAMRFANDSSGGGSGGNTYDKYSWEGVFASIDAGTYATDYAIGDMIPLDLGSEGRINMQIAAFDADDLADGSGKAPITWISKENLYTPHRMNPSSVTNSDGTYQEGTGNIGGWEKCEMRSYLKNTIKPMIPENVRNFIKEITKTQDAIDISGSAFTQTTVDDLWLPAANEFGSTYNKQAIYYTLFPNDSSKKKIRIIKGTDSTWWLRNVSTTSIANFCRVQTSGAISFNGAYNTHCYPLCFCT